MFGCGASLSISTSFSCSGYVALEEKEATANALLKKVVRSGKPAKADPQPAKHVKEKTRRLEKPVKEKTPHEAPVSFWETIGSV